MSERCPKPRDAAGERRHKGDPCIYCHIPHDDVPVGPLPVPRLPQLRA